MPDQHLAISGLVFALETPEPLSIQGEFQSFLTPGADALALRIRYMLVQAIPVPAGPPLADTGAFSLYEENGSYIRLYSWNHSPTARSRVTPDGAEVFYLSDGTRCRSLRDCFSAFPLEELLLSRGRMILHASCVETPLGGVLFSGPSGIGKSTQADLWHRFRGSEILNGDRVILHRQGGQWMASGSPYAGSSRYFINRSIPVTAVVMLEQGQENQPISLTPPEAFRLLYPQLLVNSWNLAFVKRICDLCQELIQTIPVIRFSCTPDLNAVQALDAWLKGGAAHGHKNR